MQQKDIKIFYPKSIEAWRKWLVKHHLAEQAVWVVCYTKASGKKTITWSESVDVALCFGWIDSKKIRIDEETAHQFFCKRKPNSTWSKINKTKVERLIETGLMAEAGLKSIATAKQNNSWTILDEVEELIIPQDLVIAFKNKPTALDYFSNLSRSNRKAILQWVVLAKRPETRLKRIREIVELAANKQKPTHIP